MATWSIEPSSSLVSIDNTGKLTYQEHTEDKTYTISYADGTCTTSAEITIKKCDNKFRAKYKFVGAILEHYIATFLINLYIQPKTGGTPIWSETQMGTYGKSCDDKETQISTSTDVEIELPDVIDNYELRVHIYDCHGFNNMTCVDDTSGYNYTVNGEAMTGTDFTFSSIKPDSSGEKTISIVAMQNP